MVEKYAVMALALLLFGGVYNQVISVLEARKMLEGFTWLAVVVGVGVTIGVIGAVWWMVGLVGWQWMLVSLAGFAASGTPMAMGAVWRYVSIRREEQLGMAGKS